MRRLAIFAALCFAYIPPSVVGDLQKPYMLTATPEFYAGRSDFNSYTDPTHTKPYAADKVVYVNNYYCVDWLTRGINGWLEEGAKCSKLPGYVSHEQVVWRHNGR